MKEKEVTVSIRDWLEHFSFAVYTGGEFNVVNGRGRPDMLIKKSWCGAIEVKRSKGQDVVRATKIINYAKDYCSVAKYIVDGEEQRVTDFLVATELSMYGRLFDDDLIITEKRKAKQRKFYARFPYIEPVIEWQRTADFIRSIWREWRERKGMESINIGVLYSSVNDDQATLNGIPYPKRFVMHFSKSPQRWVQWWA